MTKRTALYTLAALALTLAAPPAAAVDLHGYLRSGVGGNSTGTGQTCYGIGPIGHKFRLGNECETYAELQFDQVMFKDKSGVTFKYSGMLGYKTTQSQDMEPLWDNGTDGWFLRQNWVGATMPQWGGATAWVGKRYYQRQDIHMVDWFYWDTSGYGAGLEDINVGLGKLHVAVFQNRPQNDYAYTGSVFWRPDVRWTSIPVNNNGALDVGVSVNIFTRATPPGNPDVQEISPWFTLRHVQSDFFGGANYLVFQYATGTAANMNGYPFGGTDNNTSKSKHWRVIETFMVNPSPQWSGQFVASYADKTQLYGSADETNHWNNSTQWEVGIRPQYHFNEYISLDMDLGYQNSTAKADPGGPSASAPGKTIDMFKVSIAPTLNPAPGPGGAYYTWPKLRVFVTYATFDKDNPSWVYNDGIMNSNVGTTINDGSGLTFGAQVEANW